MAVRPVLFNDIPASELPDTPITEGQLVVIDDGTGIYLDKDGTRREIANYSATISVDEDFSTTSENPLQNKTITNSLRANSKQFFFDYQNGEYGYNTDPNRGADTFNPFKKETPISYIGGTYNTGLTTFSTNLSKGSYIISKMAYGTVGIDTIPLEEVPIVVTGGSVTSTVGALYATVEITANSGSISMTATTSTGATGVLLFATVTKYK